MNTLYYFITRKIIRNFFVGIRVIFKSLFYMISIALLSTILPIVFREYLFLPTPNLAGILTIICLVILGVALLFRCVAHTFDFDMDDEPEFFQRFIEDCCRSDTELEQKYKQEKDAKLEHKRETVRKKKEAKRLSIERIKNRSEILDL